MYFDRVPAEFERCTRTIEASIAQFKECQHRQNGKLGTVSNALCRRSAVSLFGKAFPPSAASDDTSNVPQEHNRSSLSFPSRQCGIYRDVSAGAMDGYWMLPGWASSSDNEKETEEDAVTFLADGTGRHYFELAAGEATRT